MSHFMLSGLFYILRPFASNAVSECLHAILGISMLFVLVSVLLHRGSDELAVHLWSIVRLSSTGASRLQLFSAIVVIATLCSMIVEEVRFYRLTRGLLPYVVNGEPSLGMHGIVMQHLSWEQYNTIVVAEAREASLRSMALLSTALLLTRWQSIDLAKRDCSDGGWHVPRLR